METILGEEFIKMWVRNINYCKNETAIFFSRYIYPDKDNLKISDENSSKKENPDIQTLEHLKVSFLEDIVLFHFLISSTCLSMTFLDQEQPPWSLIRPLDQFRLLISSTLESWSVLHIDQFSSLWILPLDQFYPLISSTPWSVLPLDQFYPLTSLTPWSVPSLDQFNPLTSSTPWSVLSLDQFYTWIISPLDQFSTLIH